MPTWRSQQFFGIGPAAWGVFFKYLLIDRIPEGEDAGKAYTWFSTEQCKLLRDYLLWRPDGAGYLHIDSRDIGRMSLREATAKLRWISAQRKREAEDRKRAIEEARNKR